MNQMDEKRKNVQPWQTLCARWHHIHDTCNVHMQSEDPLSEKTKQSWRGTVSQHEVLSHWCRSLVEGTASYSLVPVLLRPHSQTYGFVCDEGNRTVFGGYSSLSRGGESGGGSLCVCGWDRQYRTEIISILLVQVAERTQQSGKNHQASLTKWQTTASSSFPISLMLPAAASSLSSSLPIGDGVSLRLNESLVESEWLSMCWDTAEEDVENIFNYTYREHA